MEVLEMALRTVQQGTGQIVLLAGEAGVGKSRLVAEIRQRAVRESFTILEGCCFERDLLFPYAPLIDALRAFLATQPTVAITDLLGALAAELVKLLPELALALPQVQSTRALDPEAEKRRLFEMLAQFLIRLTQAPRTAPLLLILEDLHWCDETSLDFLHLLARRVSACPVLVLATYRREEISPHLQQLLAQLGRGRLAREVVLSPLTQSEVNALLQIIFDLSRPVRAEFLEAIYALTEGNPFFIEEVLQTLIAAGDIFYADGKWNRKFLEELKIPPSVQEAVQRRTAHLNDAARQLLTLAAAVGRRFNFALLQQLAGRDESELLRLLKELVTAQLVIEETTEQFAFRHALTRQAVYGGLLARERQVLHRGIGEIIERIYGDVLDAHVADLSYHFYEAGEWARVLDYARRAGEKAQALYAPRAVIEHFTRALVAAQRLEQVPSLAPLVRARGLAYDILGDFEPAHADLERALELARGAGDRAAEWQALVDLGKLWASRNYAQTGAYFQSALDLARTLDNPTTLAHSLNRMGNWCINVEQPLEATRCHQEALAIFQTLNDQRGLAQTFDLLAVTSMLGGDLIQSAAYNKHAAALFQGLDDRQGLASCLAFLAMGGANYSTDTVIPAAMSGVECQQCVEQAVRIAREIGWRAGEAFALILSGYSLWAQGQYGRALASIERGLEIAQEIEHRQWMGLAHRNLGALYLDLLALPAARQHLEQALRLANEIGSLYHARIATGFLVSVAILEHKYAQAEVLLDGALRPDLPMQTLAQRGIWRGRAELALAQKDPDLALQIVNRLIASAANLDTREAGAIPSLARLQGEALAALRRWAEAEATLLAALATAQAQGGPRLLWRIHLALGRLYQAQRQRGEAEQAFAAARQVVEEIAANLPDPHLRDHFLRQALALIPQPQPLSPLQAAKQLYGGLTHRESEVAALIAQGRSNRAIAEALILGERTVEGYVANILAKLGFSSRTQIASWAVQKGLFATDEHG
ncbi:MAG: AAA family ATPase [Chloroflexi bacterium]|nr:AAA family ATPase [Chloroflexota bacterium]